MATRRCYPDFAFAGSGLGLEKGTANAAVPCLSISSSCDLLKQRTVAIFRRFVWRNYDGSGYAIARLEMQQSDSL